MLKLVLVDDEAIVLKGMQKVLERRTQIELAGTAENGLAGLALIREKVPDIVLTDIRMPGMTGLEMIKELHEEFPDMVFVIFSGYNEFKYVQQAIGLGVLDYLEKPVTVQQLTKTLDKAENIIEYKRSYQRMKERAIKNDRVLVEQALYQLLNHPAEMEKECIDHLLEQGETLGFSMEIAVLCVGKLRHAQEGTDNYRRLIHEMTFSVIENHNFEIHTLMINEHIYFLYFNQECELFPFAEKINEIKKKLEESNIVFYAGISSIGQSIYDLKRLSTEAYNALAYAEFLEMNEIVNITDVEYKNRIPVKLTENQHSVEFNFRTQNYTECRNQIFAYLEVLKIEKLMPELMKHECMELVELMEQLLKETGSAGDALISYEDFLRLNTADQMIDWTHHVIDTLINQVADNSEENNADVVKIMKKYIKQHFSESISLDILAGQVHMNPTYLSVIFKKEAGVTYSNYLAKVRIEQAKIMLAEGEKAKSVCEKVGYFDYRYFNRQFKKYVGMTPDSYKKSILHLKFDTPD